MAGEPIHTERYWLTKGFAVSLSLVVALYGFIGWAQAGEWFKAILCLVAQGLAINAAIAARRAFAKDMPITGGIGLVATVLMAMWSEQGLHHAWTADGAAISPILTWTLCIIEPGLFWYAERVQMAPVPRGIDAEVDTALADIREPQGSKPRLTAIKGGLVGLSAMGIATAPPPAPRAPPSHTVAEPVLRDRARARELLAQGMMPMAVHRLTGVPLPTLKRWRYGDYRRSNTQPAVQEVA